MDAVVQQSPPRPLTAQDGVLAGLTLVMAAVSAVLLHQGQASWLEAISVVTGAVCVWLTVRESVWNFPLGMINVATFAVVFFRAGLPADAGLQVAFFILSGVGWYLWLFGGARHTRLVITRAPPWEKLVVAAGVLAAWLGIWQLLRNYSHAAAPVVDSLTTALSLGAQWLLNRKHLESWYVWIVVDIIFVPLYLSRGLYRTAGLYVVFLVMATMGLLHWNRLMREQHRRGFEVVT